jgi:hypothetical protein
VDVFGPGPYPRYAWPMLVAGAQAAAGAAAAGGETAAELLGRLRAISTELFLSVRPPACRCPAWSGKLSVASRSRRGGRGCLQPGLN